MDWMSAVSKTVPFGGINIPQVVIGIVCFTLLVFVVCALLLFWDFFKVSRGISGALKALK